MSNGHRPLQVVYFVSLFPCWSETFIVREINELIRLGVDVRIISLKHPSENLVQSDAQALLDRVIYPARWATTLRSVLRQLLIHPFQEMQDLLQLVRRLIGYPDSLAKSLVVWWRTLGLLPTIRALSPDHLHAHWATFPSTAAMLAARRVRVPFSFTAHAHDIFLEDHLLMEKMRQAAFGVTISEFNRRYLAEKVSPCANDCIRIVHCGVALADFAFRPEGREPGFIVAVGRLDEIKGFVHLIDACALLVKRGVKFECSIIGEGPLRGALQNRIDAASLGACVRLLGARPQEEVHKYLSNAAVFVLPSVVTKRGDRDGIPVALMEAMAVGLPVVSTKVSGIPELVLDGVTGLIAESGQSDELSLAIERVLTETEATGVMVRQARNKVERDFDIAKEGRKLYEAFRVGKSRHMAAAGDIDADPDGRLE